MTTFAAIRTFQIRDMSFGNSPRGKNVFFTTLYDALAISGSSFIASCSTLIVGTGCVAMNLAAVASPRIIAETVLGFLAR